MRWPHSGREHFDHDLKVDLKKETKDGETVVEVHEGGHEIRL